MSGEPEGNTVARDKSQARRRHCGVEDPRHAWKLHAREPGGPVAIHRCKARDRWEKAMSSKTHMHGNGESYRGIVPAKWSNEGSGGPKEIVEGRPLTKENAEEPNPRRTQGRESGPFPIPRGAAQRGANESVPVRSAAPVVVATSSAEPTNPLDLGQISGETREPATGRLCIRTLRCALRQNIQGKNRVR